MTDIEIKHLNGTVLYRATAETLRDCLVLAVKARANLSGANLSGADLSHANLSGADLSRADLCGANLSGAAGLNRNLVTPLLLLRDQPGWIRAYKLVSADGYGPFNGGIKYEMDQEVEVADSDEDEFTQCGRGINLADLSWCVRQWKPSYRILIAEFTAADIAAIPTATDGKFRVRRCKIVGEKDLVELGLVEAKKKSLTE